MAVLGLEFASARARAAPRSRASARTGKGNGAPRGGSCVSLRASSRDQQDEVSKMRRKLDKDYMEGKIEEAVQDAVETCEDARTSKECAIAWEAVDELRDAVQRKNLDDEGEGSALDERSVLEGKASAGLSSGRAEAGAPQSSLEGKDFLSNVDPCDVYECDDPIGTLMEAGELERKVSEGKPKGREKDEDA